MAAHTPQLAAIGISSRRPLGRQYHLNMKVQRASHCVYQIRYHMVFCIKYRRGLLVVEEGCEYLKQVLKEISERYV